ncbi:MAG: hypothetical protein SGI92_32155 [Bryobacteraceae bacterium]|nr:hypothetical protein [Bryobacteraceae bacterium]
MDLQTLQSHIHIRVLACLEETEAPVISCYLNLESGESGWRNLFESRMRLLRGAQSGQNRIAFSEALAQIRAWLCSSVAGESRGVALFARGGNHPFFLPLQFRAPLPTWIALGPTPNIYHLVELKDNYHRYVVMLSTEDNVRVLGVNLGAVTEEVWRNRPELRQRVGREWTRQHYLHHRSERINQFVNEQIGVVDQLMQSGGYSHLIVAGAPRLTSQIRKALPRHLARRLVDIIHASKSDSVSDVVAATLAPFLEAEERESVALVEQLQRELYGHGLAASGTQATFQALREQRVDALVLIKEYSPDPGCRCAACGWTDTERSSMQACPVCSSQAIREIDVRGEIARMAEQAGCRVEVVNNNDLLEQLGGVGCLLRYLRPEQYVHAASVSGN